MRLRPARAALRRHVLRFARRITETMGSDALSRPALFDMERKLAAHLPRAGGYFVEAGANDGYAQSNTYWFERMRGWRGVLVEAVPELAAACRRERPRSRVFCCALVPPDHHGGTVRIHYANLMSLVEGAQGSPTDDSAHVERALQRGHVPRTFELEVPARTLTDVLEEAGAPELFDLLSLDVEGSEASVLTGLDVSRFRPRFVLIEENFPDRIATWMEANAYVRVEDLSHRDALFGWDGRA